VFLSACSSKVVGKVTWQCSGSRDNVLASPETGKCLLERICMGGHESLRTRQVCIMSVLSVPTGQFGSRIFACRLRQNGTCLAKGSNAFVYGPCMIHPLEYSRHI
jgi:hypothetical protein